MILAGGAEFSGGLVWGPTNDPSLSALPSEYQNLRYGTSFSCSISTENGIHAVSIGLLEPNATRIGQRVFSVAVNGRQASRVDILKSVGLKTPYRLDFLVISDAANPGISLTFNGIVGNAVVSWIDVSRARWDDL